MTGKLLAEILFNLFQQGKTYDDCIREATREIESRDKIIREILEKDIETKYKGYARPIERFSDGILDKGDEQISRQLPLTGISRVEDAFYREGAIGDD